MSKSTIFDNKKNKGNTGFLAPRVTWVFQGVSAPVSPLNFPGGVKVVGGARLGGLLTRLIAMVAYFEGGRAVAGDKMRSQESLPGFVLTGIVPLAIKSPLHRQRSVCDQILIMLRSMTINHADRVEETLLVDRMRVGVVLLQIFLKIGK